MPCLAMTIASCEWSSRIALRGSRRRTWGPRFASVLWTLTRAGYTRHRALLARRNRNDGPVLDGAQLEVRSCGFRSPSQLAIGLGINLAFAPESVNRGVHQQLKKKRGDDTANHGRSNTLHDRRPGSGSPQNGHQ